MLIQRLYPARQPISCIIPPHMLREIVQRGTTGQRSIAMRTLRTSAQLNGQRLAAVELHTMQAPSALPGKNRSVYDAQTGSILPGVLVRSEGGPASADPAVNEAYDGAGFTFDLYWNIYQRNSIDASGMRLNSTVHYQKGYDNAYWNGQEMVYGDGDEDQPLAERLFNRFTIALEVIGHELTHGVTSFTAGLAYANQSGALNESISDVFGALTKQYHLAQTAAQADWIIGAGLFTPNVHGVGIRSMKAPGTAYDDPVLGKDPQPATMRAYQNTTEDNGGVHINSGIPNHAFYVTAMEIGGSAWEKAGLIWYRTLREKLQPHATFQDAANLTYAMAGLQYGAGSLEQQAARKGWSEVGIDITEQPVPTPTPTAGDGCLTALLKIFQPNG
jgi:Zn-dependent metalloprotease